MIIYFYSIDSALCYVYYLASLLNFKGNDLTQPHNKQEKVVVDNSNKSTSSIVENSEHSTQDRHHSKASSNASPKKQLLDLAKDFSLDGGLLPEDKQEPIEERLVRRIKLNKLRQQQNIEAIILRAIKHCSDNTITDRVDQDWFSHFITLAEEVSNKTMQDLWARILTNEVSQPGSFSLKTLQAFKTMSIGEARLFAKACSLAVTDYRKDNIRIITGAYQTPSLVNFFNKQRQQRLDLHELGLNYADILTLADHHLVFEQETESHPIKKGDRIHFTYSAKPLTFIANKMDCILTFYKFTPIGTELASLIKDNTDIDFLTTIQAQLAENFTIEDHNNSSLPS